MRSCLRRIIVGVSRNRNVVAFGLKQPKFLSYRNQVRAMLLEDYWNTYRSKISSETVRQGSNGSFYIKQPRSHAETPGNAEHCIIRLIAIAHIFVRTSTLPAAISSVRISSVLCGSCYAPLYHPLFFYRVLSSQAILNWLYDSCVHPSVLSMQLQSFDYK